MGPETWAPAGIPALGEVCEATGIGVAEELTDVEVVFGDVVFGDFVCVFVALDFVVLELALWPDADDVPLGEPGACEEPPGEPAACEAPVCDPAGSPFCADALPFALGVVATVDELAPGSDLELI